MKKFLQFSGLIAAALVLAAFIFLLAGNGLVYTNGNVTLTVKGVEVIFGGDYTLAATALIAWILVLLSMLALIAVSVLPLLKVKALDKFAGLITLCAAGLLIVAAILIFVSKAAFVGANSSLFKNYSLSFAFVFAGILSIFAGIIAALPACFNLLGKNK